MSTPSVTALTNLLRAHARIEQRLGGELGAVHGLALKEVLLLMHLENSPAARLSRVELSKRLSTSPSTITRMTLPLEKLHVVTRDSDPRDARFQYVVLTESGRELVSNARATLERMAVDLFRDRWTRQDIASLAELLGRLTAGEPGTLAR